MLMTVCDNPVITDICVVSTGDASFALLERDLVCILGRDAGAGQALDRFGDVSTIMIDGRPRPLVSLRDALCLAPGAAEQVVVVIRVGEQLFGLTVERVRAIEQAAILPTLDPPYPTAMFAHLVEAPGTGLLTVLKPTRLALCAGREAPVRAAS